MKDRAMSETAMLASLRDIDLLSVAPGGIISEIAVVIALASLAALLVAGLLRLLSRKRAASTGDSLRESLARLESAPEAERRVALLHLLRSNAPERYAAIRGAIYEPGGGVDTATLEAEVARLV